MELNTDINIKDILTLVAFCFVVGLSYAENLEQVQEQRRLESLYKLHADLERRVDKLVTSDGSVIPSKEARQSARDILIIKMRVDNIERKLNKHIEAWNTFSTR